MSEPRKKGRVGAFEVWLVGKMQWEIRKGGAVVDRAANMSEAFRKATRLNGGIYRKAELDQDLTPEGVQYVMPGCEKDRSKGANQMELF